MNTSFDFFTLFLSWVCDGIFRSYTYDVAIARTQTQAAEGSQISEARCERDFQTYATCQISHRFWFCLGKYSYVVVKMR